MARHHAPLLTSIWDNDGFRALTAGAQRLYMQLLSQKRLTLAGVVPYSPRNLARGCDELTVADIERDVAELVANDYVFVDVDTDELMVRTILKHDPPRGSKTIAGMWNAWREIDSEDIRRRIVNQISTDIWGHETVYPPPEAKALRNAPSDGAFQTRNPQEDEQVSAIGHLPPTTSHLPSSDLPSEFRRPTRSTGAATNGETTTTELNRRIDAVLHELADHQMANASVTPVNLLRYRAQVVNTLLRQHGDRIRTFVTDRPDSPPDTLAQALKGEIS